MPTNARPAPTSAHVDAEIAASSSKATARRAPKAAGESAAPRGETYADLEGGTGKLPPGPPAITATPRPAAVALRARRGGRAGARVRTSAPMVSTARTDPASNPDFQSAVIQIRVAAARQRRHDHQNVKRQEVVKSALLDKEAQTQQSSEDRNVAAMGTVGQKQLAQSATFKDAKAKKFKEDFHKIVDANPPATESDARKLANREQAVQPFEGPFSKNLADQQAVVTKPLDQRAKNEPAIEVAPPKEAKPIPRPVYPPAPGPVNPALVVPKPKPDPEVSLKEDSDRLDGAMQKNRLSDDQLANSKEPSFLKTLKAKQDAQQKIVEARSAYRRQESAILQGATAQANQAMSTELAGMSRAHTRTGGVVHGGQKGTENDTKRRQREIKKAIDDIYKWTADGVADILKCMTTKVTEDFRNSLKTQTEAFNKNVTKALDNYYSFGKKAKHFFLGEPKVVVDKATGNTRDLRRDDWDTSTFPPRIITPWINPEVYDIFKEEKKKFTDAMEVQLDVIAADVEKGLTAASERIKVGMAKVTAYKNTLTGNEKRFADELEEDVKARFQSLEESIDDARQDLLKSLADEYRESVNQLEKTFNDINEEMRKSWLDRAIEFVETVGKTIFQLAELLFSILVRVAYLVWDIVKHPIRFFETLVAGLKQGISDFIDDIGTHLKEAFWTCLTDATPGTTIRLSLNAGVAGLFDLVMQVLRLGPADLRAIVDKILGPEFMQMVDKGMAFADKAFEPIVILFTKGPVAFWDYIKEQLEDIIQSAFDRIKESVFLAFVKKGILWIAGFFVPGGGFVKIVKAIVRAFQFVAENLERIRRFFDAVFDSMEAAVQGNPAGLASKIVTGLKMGIVLALGFLARQLGLNAIIDSVHKILHSLRRPIVNAIEWLLRKVKPFITRIVKRVGGRAKAAGPHDVDRPVTFAHEPHVVRVHHAGPRIQILMSSNRFIAVDQEIEHVRRHFVETYLKDRPKEAAELASHLAVLTKENNAWVARYDSAPDAQKEQVVNDGLNHFVNQFQFVNQYLEQFFGPWATVRVGDTITYTEGRPPKDYFGTVTEIMAGGHPVGIGIKARPVYENPKGHRVAKARMVSLQEAGAVSGAVEVQMPYAWFGSRWKRATGNAPLMPGSAQNPFLLTWPKPAWHAYPKLYFGGPRPPTLQSVLKALAGKDPSVREFPPSGGNLGGQSIGIAKPYRLDVGSPVGPLTNKTTPGGKKLIDILRPYGYDPETEPLQVDHVQDVQIGGADDKDNLWPLHESINRAAGPRLAGARARFRDGSGKDVALRDLKRLGGTQFYFEIEQVK